MGILISTLYFITFCFFIARLPFFKLNGIDKKWMIATFSVKFLCGMLLWTIYSFYYTDRASADIFKYFDDANIIYQQAAHQPSLIFQISTGIVWQKKEVMDVLANTNHWFRSFDYIQINDNRIIIRLNLLLLYFSRGVFHVHTLFFTFLAFIGSVGLYRFFSYYEKRKPVLFICAFLLPSVIFWTSGVLKESWLFFLMGLFLYHFQKLMLQSSFLHLFKVVILILALLFIKPFILILLAPGLVFLLLRKAFSQRKEILIFMVFYLSLLLVMILYVIVGGGKALFELMQSQQDAFYRIAKEIGNVSTIPIADISTFWNAILAAPEAIFNTLFRPLIWETNNILQLVAAVENLLYLLLVIATIFFHRKPERLSLILFCVSFVILLAVIIGWTTPVLGTIVRYKVPLLPFFAILLFQFIHFGKLRNLFK